MSFVRTAFAVVVWLSFAADGFAAVNDVTPEARPAYGGVFGMFFDFKSPVSRRGCFGYTGVYQVDTQVCIELVHRSLRKRHRVFGTKT